MLLCLSPVLPALPPKGSVQVTEVAGDLQRFVARPTLQTERAKGKDKHTHCKENMTSANLNPDALNSVKAGASRVRVTDWRALDAHPTGRKGGRKCL